MSIPVQSEAIIAFVYAYLPFSYALFMFLKMKQQKMNDGIQFFFEK